MRSALRHIELKKIFEDTFQEDFNSARIVGAFDILDILKMNLEEAGCSWFDKEYSPEEIIEEDRKLSMDIKRET